MANHKSLTSLDLRGCYISLQRYFNSNLQHKGKTKALIAHVNKTLPTQNLIVAPVDATFVSIDNNCIVKFHKGVRAPKTIERTMIDIHVFKNTNKWVYSSFQMRVVIEQKEKKLAAVKVIGGALYKLMDGAGFLRCGDYAVKTYKENISYDKIIVDSVDSIGNAVNKLGDIIIKKDHIKYFTLICY